MPRRMNQDPARVAPSRASGFRPLLDGCGVPEGMPPKDWRRLRVLGRWSAAAGHPIGTMTRAVSFDAAGVLTIRVPSAQWASELTPLLETLRTRLGTLSGERVARIVLDIEPGVDGPRR